MVNGMEIFPFDNLKQVISFIEKRSSRNPKTEKSHDEPKRFETDFSDVHGYKDIMKYVIAAAAGNHNLLLVGAPGCGKSMIAKEYLPFCRKCTCSPYEIKRYTQRISGLILYRIDTQKYMGKVNLFECKNSFKNLSSREIRYKVQVARKMQLKVSFEASFH